MHETIVAQSVVDTILEEAEKAGKRPVSAVISCGQLNPINDHVMKFAFENAVKDTICEGMKLEVVHNRLKAVCKKCGKEFEFDIYSCGCPGCQGEDVEILPDAPLLLEEIEFED